MSQLEQQYDELEEVGRDIEQALRDAEESKCDVLLCAAERVGWGGHVRQWLRALGQSAQGTSRPAERVSLVRPFQFNLLLLGRHLPKISGFQLKIQNFSLI